MKSLLVLIALWVVGWWCWPAVCVLQQYLINNFSCELKAEQSHMKMREIRKGISELDSEMSTMVHETEKIMSASPRTKAEEVKQEFIAGSAVILGEAAAIERGQLVESWGKEKVAQDVQLIKSARKTILRMDQEPSP